jgi:NitT/TauT family transport system ATP-binding protein
MQLSPLSSGSWRRGTGKQKISRMGMNTRVAPLLQLTDLDIVYPDGGITAVEGFNAEFNAGEFVCIVGPTGCGKSTILNAIAGFIAPTRGTILKGGSPVVGPGPDRGIVFQTFALFPWKTVRGNIEFGPMVRGLAPAERRSRSTEMLQRIGLAARADAYPHQLSGGMQQRVAIARALVNGPDVMLMDEPFGSLDAQTRGLMQSLLLDLWQTHQKTVIFVTHDIDESIFLADRIIVLTARPARVKAEIAVRLGRPRQREVMLTGEFLETKRQVLAIIQEEVEKSFASN